MVDCKGLKCLKEINPEQYPGVFAGGDPWVYDENYGACVDCQRQFEDEEIRKLKQENDNVLQQEGSSELLE